MQQIQPRIKSVSTIYILILLQLFISQLITPILVIWGRSFSENLVVIGALLGFLLTLNIPYSLHVIDLVLGRIVRKQPIEPITGIWFWPFSRLFTLLNALGSQNGQQSQREQQTVEYRDQLLQQVSKAAAQEERNRLARDLHDSIKQQIFSVVMSAAAVKARWEHDPQGARQAVDDIVKNAREAQVEMQALLQQLRPSPLENIGLTESLRTQCQALEYRTGAKVYAEFGTLAADERFPVGSQEMIFRIVQEAFANIARHARASQVWFTLSTVDDEIVVEMKDDGQGFDLAQGTEHRQAGMGLSNIRERAEALKGNFMLQSAPGEGTSIHITIPLTRTQLLAEEQSRDADIMRQAYWARRGWMVATGFTLLPLGMLLFDMPHQYRMVLGFLSLALACVLCLWFESHRTYIALSLGRLHPQTLSLTVEVTELLSGIFCLCALSVLDVFDRYPSPIFIAWYVFFLILFFCLTVIFSLLHARARRNYHALLSIERLRLLVSQRQRQSVINVSIWIVVLCMTIYFTGGLSSLFEGTTLASWLAVALWFLIIIEKWFQTLRLRTRCVEKEA